MGLDGLSESFLGSHFLLGAMVGVCHVLPCLMAIGILGEDSEYM